MKKWKKVLLTAVPATLCLSFTSMAGQWHQDMNGWWYENNDGSYCRNGWYWLDGNQDGEAECYYFGNKGYMINAFGHVDGYEVNEDGAWTVNGEVQRIAVAIDRNNDSAAMDAYMAAQKKNNALDATDVNVDYVITTNMAEEHMEMGMNMDMKCRGAQSGKLEFVANGSMKMSGIDMPIQIFYTDGVYYMDMLGMKIKQEMPMEQAMEQAAGQMNTAEVNADMLLNLRMRQEGENTILTYDISVSDFNRLLNGIVGASGMETQGVHIAYDMKSSHGEIVINPEGYYTGQKMFMDMDMTVTDPETKENNTICYQMDMNMVVNNPGQPVEFEIPSKEGFLDVKEAEAAVEQA